MTDRKIHIALPTVGEEEWLATRESFDTGWLTQGPKVAAFEKQFSKIHGTDYALATTSCTTALHLILAAMGIGEGDEVIVPAFTWVATANVVLYCGAKPVFADVTKESFNLSENSVLQKITDQTKAIIAVHLFGLCMDVDSLKSKIPSHIKIIEDAACAAYATLNGQFAGALGDAAAFSFHPRKSITTGEGGMVTTNDDHLADIMQKMRNHGAEISEEQRHHGPRPYSLPEFNLLGFNYRMTDLQGAVGLEQLKKLPTLIEQRRQFAEYYRQALSSIDWLQLPQTPVNAEHAWQAYVVLVDPDKAPMPRNQIMDLLHNKGIATRPGTHAVHLLNYYRETFDISANEFPNATFCDTNSMAIPLHNRMQQDDFDYIVEQLTAIDNGTMS